MYLNLLPGLRKFFCPLGCLSQPRCEGSCLVLLYSVLLCWLISFGGLILNKEEMEGGVDLGERGSSGEQGRVKEEKNV